MQDYLVIGAGLYGAVFARKMIEAGRKVLVLEQRSHLGGNVYTKLDNDIVLHFYGPHLFHTASKEIWDYVNRFAKFNHYQHRVKANYQGKIYSLPFNLMTYYQMWGCTSPAEARVELQKQIVPIPNPKNLEEWAISHVGTEIYDKLIYGYTKKQWARDPKELPASLIRRLPLRMTFDDNYFGDPYQGVPIDGYTPLVENILDGIDVKLGEDYFDLQDWRTIANKLVYSGPIDQFFGCELGPLEYRGLAFKNEVVEGDFQGIGQMNYTDTNVPWTRIVEHKHFRFQQSKKSVITYEYPCTWTENPYYPVNDHENNALYDRYRAMANKLEDVIIGGRLGSYKYFDMDQTIAAALHAADKELKAERLQ